MSLLSLLQCHLTGWSLFGKADMSSKKLNLCSRFPPEFRWWNTCLFLQGSWKMPSCLEGKTSNWYDEGCGGFLFLFSWMEGILYFYNTLSSSEPSGVPFSNTQSTSLIFCQALALDFSEFDWKKDERCGTLTQHSSLPLIFRSIRSQC